MEIEFQIGNAPVKFQRNWLFGGMRLVTPHETTLLQHPANPLTHFSTRLKQSWEGRIEGQSVVVEKVRPLLLAGLRPQSYKVFVNDQLVAEAHGY